MAAFNEWVKGSFLEPPEGRRVATVAMNILYGMPRCSDPGPALASRRGWPSPPGIPRLAPLTEPAEIEAGPSLLVMSSPAEEV